MIHFIDAATSPNEPLVWWWYDVTRIFHHFFFLLFFWDICLKCRERENKKKERKNREEWYVKKRRGSQVSINQTLGHMLIVCMGGLFIPTETESSLIHFNQLECVIIMMNHWWNRQKWIMKIEQLHGFWAILCICHCRHCW